MRSRLLASSLLLVLACLQAPSRAQEPQPAWLDASLESLVRTALDVEQVSIQRLRPRVDGDAPLEIGLVLRDGPAVLALRPHDLAAPGFEVLVDRGRGPVPEEIAEAPLFRGALAGRPGSAASARVEGLSVEGLLWIPGGGAAGGKGRTLAIQPLAELIPPPRGARPGDLAGWHAVHRAADRVAGPLGTCGVAGTAGPGGGGGMGGANDQATIRVCEIAVEADHPYFLANGSSVQATTNDVMQVVAANDVIFRRDVDVTFRLTRVVVRTTAASDPYTTTDPGGLLSAFRGHWRANFQGVPRDVAHLFTGRDLNGSVIGIAYVSVVCTSSAYAVSQARFTTNLTSRVGLVAHEIGHNFSAPHCNSSTPCNIMCSGLGGCSNDLRTFAPVTINQIRPYVAGRSCLAPLGPPVVTSITPSTTGTLGGERITLRGTGLDEASAVSCAGRTVVPPDLRILGPTELSFPAPRVSNPGFTSVQVQSTTTGPSNTVRLVYGANLPPRIVGPAAALGGQTLSLDLGGDLGGHLWALLVGPSPAPVRSVLGLNLIDPLVVLGTGSFDRAGQANWSVPVPPGLPLAFFDLQLVDLDPVTGPTAASPFYVILVIP